MDDESDWRKQLLVGLGVLVIVALLVGGVVGVIAIKAADVAGIGGTPPSDTGGITFPSFTSTKSPETSSSSTPSAPTGSTPPTTSAEPPKKSGIKLTASPTEAGTYQRVNLTGTYTGATPGTSLQVQRRQGTTWTSFSSVTASVNAGQFSTWIETGQPGANRFRMFDAGAGKASNVVTVTIS